MKKIEIRNLINSALFLSGAVGVAVATHRLGLWGWRELLLSVSVLLLVAALKRA